MAYQFFAKAPAQKQRRAAASSPPLSSPSLPTSLSKPPLHPPPLVLPQSTSSFPSSKPPSIGDPAFQAVPFTEPIASHQTPHPHITIDQVRTAHIQSLTRITSLLLPVRYSGSFYTACITDPVISSLARVAVYHDHPVTAGPELDSTAAGGLGGTDKVIGGIRCRLEKLPAEFAGRNSADDRPPTNLYIQTLHLLSPHRGNGVAAALLHSLLYSEPVSTGSKSNRRVSALVRHYNIRTVTAHVHETNDDALNWYMARGFRAEDGVIKGYYRRLNPDGAKVVRLDLDWEEQEEKKHQEKVPQSETESREVDEDDNDDDDDWEKLEAEDDDADDHGVVHLSDSRILDGGEDSQSTANSVKRKRDEKDEDDE